MKRRIAGAALVLAAIFCFAARGDEAKIARDDLLLIKVKDLVAVGISNEFVARVQTDGTVFLPPVQRIKVEGKTCSEAQQTIHDRLKEAKNLRNPVVTITVKEPAAQAKVHAGPINPGEQLEVHVWDFENVGQDSKFNIVVADDGTAQLPRLDRFMVVGLDEADAAQLISKKYFEANLLRNAMVTVLRLIEKPK